MSASAPSPRSRRSGLAAGLLLLGIAAALRWGHLPVGWSYWTVDYLSYPFPHRDDLSQGLLPWTRLVGLHPGQHGLLCAALGAGGASLRALLLLSVAFSVAAAGLGGAWLGARVGMAAGLSFLALLAVSPYQVHYGLEPNNYPLFLLGAAAMTVSFDGAWDRPEGRRLLALLLATTLALHGHLAALPLAASLGAVALWARRWRLVGVLGVAGLLASPVIASVARMRSVGSTFHNEQPGPAELLRAVGFEAWVGRFGTAPALGLALAATVLAAVLAVRSTASRRQGLLLLLLFSSGTATTLLGMARGAASMEQTPYWIFGSWCLFGLLALGFAVAGRRARIALLLLLLPWTFGALQRGLLPASAAEASEDSADPAALEAYIAQALEPGDVLLYLWDARWLNDDPTRRDPLLAAIPPGKVGDWLPRERPWPGFGHRLGEAEVYFVNSTSMRGGEQEAALRAALLRFLAEGRTTHAVLVPDPAQPPSDPRALLAAVSEAGGSWSSRWVDRVEVVVVRPISP